MLVGKLDVINLIVNNLEATLHATHDSVHKHLFTRWPKDTFSQINIVVILT